MQNETISPINHGVVSATGHTVAGAAGGAVKSGLQTIGYTALVCAGIGAVWATGGLGLFATGVGSTFLSGLLGAAAGGLAGGVVLGPLFSVFTGTYGAVKGGANAANRVREEKGASNAMQAQLETYRAQALASQMAPTTVYAPSATNDNKYSGASTMNLAPSTIQQGDAQLQGMVNGMGLQRA
jgi:hypothetical protein